MTVNELMKNLSAWQVDYGDVETVIIFNNGHAYLDIVSILGVGDFPGIPKKQLIFIEGSK